MTKHLRYLCTLLLLVVVSVGWGQDLSEINFTQSTSSIEFTDFSGAGSYNKETPVSFSVTGNDNNSYLWTKFYCMAGSSTNSLQMHAGDAYAISPTIKSSRGFTVNVTFTATNKGNLKLQIGEEDAVTGTGIGTTGTNNDVTITATTTLTETTFKLSNIKSGSNSAAVYVSKIEIVPTAEQTGPVDPTVTFASNPFEVEVGATGTNIITKPSDLTVSYSSSDENTATVDENGVVTGMAVGEATITATWAAVENKYNEGSASYTVNVTAATEPVVFEKVTSANQLVAGNEYILVATNSNMAMGAQDQTKYRTNVGVTIDDNIISITNEAVASLTLAGSSGEWTFLASDNAKYLGLNSSANELHSLDDGTSENAKWIITDNFELMHKNTSRYIRYNSGSPRFACYTSGQQTAVLFMKQGGVVSQKEEANLQFSPATVSLEAGTTENVEFTQSTTATVEFDNSDPTVATYDATSGTVTALKAGTTTITATSAANEDYLAGEATLTITVTAPAVTEVKVTDNNPYEESLATDFGNFTTDNSTIWTHATYNNNGYAKATSYISGSNTDGDAWLTSPVIDLTEVVQAELEFSQAINKFFGTVAEEAMLCIKDVEDDPDNWVQQEITYPSINSGSFSSFVPQTLDISEYAGKKIVVGFHYIGHSTGAGTWEVNNFKVSGSSTIQLKDAGLAFNPSTISVEENATATVEFSKATTADVTFANEDPTVATYDASTGTVTGLKAGTTTITASSAENEEYAAGTATLTITVIEATTIIPVTEGCGIYQKITSADDLEAGKRYLIVYENEGTAFVYNGKSGTNNFAGKVDGTVTNNRIDNTSLNAVPVVLQSAGTDKWFIMDGSTFLYWSSGNYLYWSESAAQAGNTWNINFVENGMSISNVDTPARYLQYNSSSPRFACYTGSQKDVTLFKELLEAPQPETIEVTISAAATDGSVNYGTLYYSNKNLTVPDGLTAYTASVSNGSLTLSAVTGAIPAGTGVVLKTDSKLTENTTFTFTEATEGGTVVAGNMLKGNDEDAETTGGAIYYQLSRNANKDPYSIGFYWGAENGGAFTNKGHRAYLAVSNEEAKGISGFAFGDDTDGIGQIENGNMTMENAEIYNLAGQRVNKAQKGIYIVNGKKIVIK